MTHSTPRPNEFPNLYISVVAKTGNERFLIKVDTNLLKQQKEIWAENIRIQEKLR